MILSFTSIPPRFPFLGRVIQQLEKQTVRPDAVELYLPRTYRRFPGERPALPKLPDWVKIIDIERFLIIGNFIFGRYKLGVILVIS